MNQATPSPTAPSAQAASIDCGWGNLHFGQTYDSPTQLVAALRLEAPSRRDIAFYVCDPHVVLAHAPEEIFLDPSHTFRHRLDTPGPVSCHTSGFSIRPLASPQELASINKIYAMRNMPPIQPTYADCITILIGIDDVSGAIIGAGMGIDHHRAFGDAERGSSLWSIAVNPLALAVGIGEALVVQLLEHFRSKGCAFTDLSVLHSNSPAIALYTKLGFERVPIFTVKRRNTINAPLFTAPSPERISDPSARLIIDTARRRKIGVRLIDAVGDFFELTHGTHTIRCQGSLSALSVVRTFGTTCGVN